MDNEDRLYGAVAKLQQTITELKGDLRVVLTKQNDYLDRFARGTEKMDEHSARLRTIEATQMLHKGYFALFGAALLACAGLLVSLFQT